MAKKKTREQISLECTVCQERNYFTEKNKAKTTVRLELKKFCGRCRQVSTHKETK